MSSNGFKSKNSNIITHKQQKQTVNYEYLSILPYSECDNIDLANELIEINLSTNHINCFKELKDQNFSVLHLNINSLYLKREEITEILDLKLFDVVFLQETKLNESVPNTFFHNSNYQVLRLDRNKHGGGILIFIRIEYKLLKSIKLDKIEGIYFQLDINGVLNNFISCYKPPNVIEIEFLNVLEFLNGLYLHTKFGNKSGHFR